jgi:hypothetical protein
MQKMGAKSAYKARQKRTARYHFAKGLLSRVFTHQAKPHTGEVSYTLFVAQMPSRNTDFSP